LLEDIVEDVALTFVSLQGLSIRWLHLCKKKELPWFTIFEQMCQSNELANHSMTQLSGKPYAQWKLKNETTTIHTLANNNSKNYNGIFFL